MYISLSLSVKKDKKGENPKSQTNIIVSHQHRHQIPSPRFCLTLLIIPATP